MTLQKTDDFGPSDMTEKQIMLSMDYSISGVMLRSCVRFSKRTIITGGAIKLTATMQERQHTDNELKKLEKVRRFLIDEHICDNEGFIDYLNELS